MSGEHSKEPLAIDSQPCLSMMAGNLCAYCNIAYKCHLNRIICQLNGIILTTIWRKTEVFETVLIQKSVEFSIRPTIFYLLPKVVFCIFTLNVEVMVDQPFQHYPLGRREGGADPLVQNYEERGPLPPSITFPPWPRQECVG